MPGRRGDRTIAVLRLVAAAGTAACVLASSSPSLFAADVIKANNTDNLNLNSAWQPGSSPTAADVAVWDSTVTSANASALGADLTWGGIRIADPGGPVTISAG